VGTQIASIARDGAYLTFQVARHHFAIDATRLRGILPIHELISPSDTAVGTEATSVRGVASLRGSSFPVVDLQNKLGLKPMRPGKRPCIVVVDTLLAAEPGLVRGLIGFVADRVCDVVSVRKRDLENGKVRMRDGRLRKLIDPDQLVTDVGPVPKTKSARPARF